MELLRKAMEDEFSKNGNTEKAIRLSQELDVIVAKEQRKRLIKIKLVS